MIEPAMNPARESRQAAALTIGTWVLSGLLYLLPVQLFRDGPTAFMAASVVAICATGMLLSAGVFAAARRMRERPRAAKAATMIAAVAAASALLALLDALMSGVLARLFEPGGAVTPFGLRATSNFTAFVWQFALLGAFYVVLEANARARERERLLADARTAASEANAAASAARLAALRYQLNPHFLFNTLNAISSLVVTRRSVEADAMLAKLSDFLRATLSADPEALIALEDELATLQSYLEIESVRFGDRLAVEFVCPPDLHDALVPSFVLQPLVENAIKYAVSPTSRTVTIRVEATSDGPDLVVTVDDDGDGARAAEARAGTGVGLRNIRQRLDALYGARGVLEAARCERGFLAVVRLPLERRAASLARVA
jgi:signal transduction histidine kinase